MPARSRFEGLLRCLPTAFAKSFRPDETGGSPMGSSSSISTSTVSSSSSTDEFGVVRAPTKQSAPPRPSWRGLVWGALVVLACMLVVLRVSGVISRTETFKYTAMLLSATLAIAGASSRQAPPPRVRALCTATILVITILITLLPWLTFGIHAWRVCDRHFYRGTDDEVWFLRPGFVDVSFVALITPAAMACAAAWYPPSYYARGAVLCIIMIWLMKLGWVSIGFLNWCGNPFPAVDENLLTQILLGVSIGLLVVSLLMVNLLLVLRVEALEDSWRQKRSGPLRWLVGVYCFLVLANDSIAGRKQWDWINAFPYIPIPGLTDGHATWIDVVFPLLPIAISVLTVRAFAMPLRVLEAEAKQVRGAPQAQATWAAQRLRREMAGALCMTLTSVAKLSFQPFSWALGRTGTFLLSLISSIDDLGNVLGTLIMCGVLWQSEPPAPPPRPPCQAALESLAKREPAWQRQVERLAGRGFTLGSLLDFLEELLDGEVMPSFSPRLSTTNDVVRHAIIPLSRGSGDDAGGYALATVWNAGRPVLPQRMVTHNWDNVFLHLVASIVADGLGCDTYEQVAESLVDEHGVSTLRQELQANGTLAMTYWVCAFSVNQHAGICGGFGPPPPQGSQELQEWTAKKHDSNTGLELPVCTCREPKFFSSSPVECEMNKFDDMMAYLFQEVPGFRQIVAVDTSFRLFTRAWCVAELAEADARGMSQVVKIHSESGLESHYDDLSLLDVQECQASRVDDKDFILGKIGNIDIFNSRLQWLIFGAEGLFKSWANYRDRAASIGRITRRAMLHANSLASSETDNTGVSSV